MTVAPTTWKTVAVQALRDNYSKEEILNLYMSSGKGKRNAGSEDMQTVSEEKRLLISGKAFDGGRGAWLNEWIKFYKLPVFPL